MRKSTLLMAMEKDDQAQRELRAARMRADEAEIEVIEALIADRRSYALSLKRRVLRHILEEERKHA